MVDYKVAADNVLLFLALRRHGRWTRLRSRDQRNATPIRQGVVRLLRMGFIELGGGDYMRATARGMQEASKHAHRTHP